MAICPLNHYSICLSVSVRVAEDFAIGVYSDDCEYGILITMTASKVDYKNVRRCENDSLAVNREVNERSSSLGLYAGLRDYITMTEIRAALVPWDAIESIQIYKNGNKIIQYNGYVPDKKELEEDIKKCADIQASPEYERSQLD